MLNAEAQKTAIIEAIPEPQQIRERLGENLREANLLRRLLKIAEKASEERQQRGERRAANA